MGRKSQPSPRIREPHGCFSSFLTIHAGWRSGRSRQVASPETPSTSHPTVWPLAATSGGRPCPYTQPRRLGLMADHASVRGAPLQLRPQLRKHAIEEEGQRRASARSRSAAAFAATSGLCVSREYKLASRGIDPRRETLRRQSEDAPTETRSAAGRVKLNRIAVSPLRRARPSRRHFSQPR